MSSRAPCPLGRLPQPSKLAETRLAIVQKDGHNEFFFILQMAGEEGYECLEGIEEPAACRSSIIVTGLEHGVCVGYDGVKMPVECLMVGVEHREPVLYARIVLRQHRKETGIFDVVMCMQIVDEKAPIPGKPLRMKPGVKCAVQTLPRLVTDPRRKAAEHDVPVEPEPNEITEPRIFLPCRARIRLKEDPKRLGKATPGIQGENVSLHLAVAQSRGGILRPRCTAGRARNRSR